ncbi:MAG: general secretion pathway protein GspE [Deltaproteobacteria bacterium]|nr:general secretion pathway protein GspE [Deltaproteobacteria bacterium]
MTRKRLGEVLLERGAIDQDQLNSALAYQRQWGHRLGVAMVAKGFISEGVLTKVLSESLSIPMIDLAAVTIDKEALRMLHVSVCEAHDVIPVNLTVEKGRKILVVAMSDPLNVAAIEEIEFTTSCTVRPVLAQISSIGQAIRRYYRGERVQIAPLQFKLDQGAHETMTVVRKGGEEEMIQLAPTGEAQKVVALRDEVTDRTALAEIEAARRIGRAGAAAAAAISQIDIERIDALEKKFWAMMRVLARKNYITKDEFLAELSRTE